jgi:hypothetical protein
MLQTYKAILRGNTVEWLGEAPPTNGGIAVHITLLREHIVPDADRGERLRLLLEELAKRNPFKDITDPVEWQREIRKDRPLPGRDDEE